MEHKKLIAKMTLEEKASFMSGKDFWTTRDMEKYDIPPMFLSDGPHGIRKQAGEADQLGLNESLPATCFPTSATVANSWDVDLGERLGQYLGKEAVSQEVNVLLGPGTNIKRNPLCGRNFEYFSEDPFLAGKMSAAYVRGIQSNGISACLKHFAANNQEYRRLVMDSVVDERTLREIYLRPFRTGIDEGKLKTLMSSYNKVNGTHANENKHLMQDILRDEWKYDGVVVTDWGGSNKRIEGLKAGNALEMPGTDGETNEDIVRAVKNGDLDESVLDENLDRLLTLILDTSEAIEHADVTIDEDDHHAMARRVAEESIVLLKNDDHALPLASDEKVAVIGDFAREPRYQGAGSSIVNPRRLDDTLSVIDAYGFDYVGFEPGFKRYGKHSKRLIKKALKLADKADTLLVYVGLDEHSEAEGIDRKDMKMPENQLELLRSLSDLDKKIVVVLSCGSAVEMDFADDVDAIVHTYLSGQAGARATLNVLTGEINPSGKLAESHPYRYEDTSTAKYFPGREMTAEYREGLYVGYRYYDSDDVDVRYPFGFGLSYTRFEYSDVNVTRDEVTFNIKNIGDVAGKEIAQVYVAAKDSHVYRPEKELKGFKKVAVEPGKSVSVTVKLGDEAFRFFNPDTSRWEIEEGDYEIRVGSSSRDIRLRGTIHVDGIKITPELKKKDIPHYMDGDVQDVPLDEFEKLLGRDVPDPHYPFYKKNRLVVGYNTTVEQLRYSKRWVGRFFSGAIRFAIWFLHAIGNHALANELTMGMLHQPMRGLSRMSGGMICWGQLDGLIMMFNGHFFKGLGKFFREGIKRKKAKKSQEKEAEKHE